jgi:hypothetical protein
MTKIMKVAIMQPYIFPYIGYFQLIQAVDKFIFYDDVNFIKKGWINRNQILINNQAHLITIPLNKASQNILIKDTLISYEENWAKKLLNNLEHNYKKAPYFNDAYSLIKQILEKNFNTISDFAINSIIEVSNYLEINTNFELSSEKYMDSIYLKKELRLIGICKKNNATDYINPIGGKEIYTKEDFKNKGLKLKFIEPQINEYKQFNSGFISGLSIIDVLMFNSKEEVRKMLNNYELI